MIIEEVNMLKYFENKYAMTNQGARDLAVSIFWSLLLYLSFMMPVMLAFRFLNNRISATLNQPSDSLAFYIVASVVMFLVMSLISLRQYQTSYTKIYEESALRRIKLAEILRKLPLSFFGKKDISDLSATIMEDTTQIETLFSHAVPQLYASVISIVIMGILMFAYNWQLSVAVFWVIPVSAIVFMSSRKFQKTMHKKMYGVKRNLSDKIQEGIDLAHEIKAYNREELYAEQLNKQLDGYEQGLIKSELLIGALINLSYVFLKLGLPSVILLGGTLLYQGSISILTYLAFLIISSRIYGPIMDVLNNLSVLLFLDVRIKRMQEMDDMPRQTGKKEINNQGYDITFKNVGFSYDQEIQTLKEVSFTAKQGEVTALVGPSGGGKSTVAKLAARFWDIDSGTITLGGEDISQVDPEVLLSQYAIVFQDVTLFNSSVMDNIRIGKIDATEDEIVEAAKQAQCHEFISALPNGYDTIIGENGEKLSGGERQRISIARAILKDAPVILLDEATASLDTKNESKIQQALSVLIKNKTVLIIAHRMRTVSNADQIVVIKDGEIVELGTPHDLKKLNGIFASMVKTQSVA